MTSTDLVATDRVRWTFSPAERDALRDDDLRLDEHVAAGRATVIKHGRHRTVYRIALGNETVYWKVCQLYGPRAWWRDFFRGPKAKLEFDRARELAARGIATVEPLAWGRMGGFWPPASHLITRELERTVPLDEYLLEHPPQTPKARRALTAALASFIARLHDAGVTHPDLHPGNLLVRLQGGSHEFFLIDVHDIQLGRPLDRAARRANLALLNRWFQVRCARSDRLRFWRAYGGANDERVVEVETAQSIMRLWESHHGRCLRASRHFQPVSGGGVRGFAASKIPAKIRDDLVSDPDQPFKQPDAVLLKDSRSATVCVLTIADGPPLIYKRFRVKDWSDPLLNMVRSGGALRSWKAGHAFLDRQLPTPRPWLMLYRRRLGFPTTGYLLCEAVQPARHLQDVVRSGGMEKRVVIDTLARWIRLMHERGVSNRDLKAANILVSAGGECQFIDLVGVRLRRNVRRRLRVRDLARLNASFVSVPEVSRTDRLRFLRVYLLWGLRGSAGWKEWWKEVAQATEAKVRRNALRNRPLG
jgi:tRNA A-37 threonylcarbamoyl transferase component Bud32